MSMYELVDYDGLQRRIGLEPKDEGWSWHCGNNPSDEFIMDQPGATYDDPLTKYSGRSPRAGGGIVLSEDINVNGLLLNHRDLNNTIWVCTDIEGWWTLPPAEIPDVPKPTWDGSLMTTGRYLTRTITISGLFLPPHPELVWYNRDAILRVAGVVRGIGLLAMCGNENPDLNLLETPTDPFLDQPKMAIIQTNDVPLVETYNTRGDTRFSMSFRCVNPAKVSVYEKKVSIPYENNGVVRTRKYHAFSLGAGQGGGLTTEYAEVLRIRDTDQQRHYPDVLSMKVDAPIEDEELYTTGNFDPASYQTATSSNTVTLHNTGNYFAFPTFVFDTITGASTTKPITIRNITTNESMQIQMNVSAGHQLVVDCGMRRVGEVDPNADAPSWKFDDRNYLTLASQWITLAPGPNTVLVSMDTAVTKTSALPRVYWRDTWIG
jgi:hypothetical protein